MKTNEFGTLSRLFGCFIIAFIVVGSVAYAITSPVAEGGRNYMDYMLTQGGFFRGVISTMVTYFLFWIGGID